MKATLNEFLEKGELGSLRLGASGEQVRQLLGPPEDISVSKRPVIWKYGALELAFSPNRTVDFLGIYFHEDLPRLPPTLTIDGWMPSRETSLAEVQETLARANVSFLYNPAGTSDDQVMLLFGPGVSAIFSRENGRSHLDSIQFSEGSRKPGARWAVEIAALLLDIVRIGLLRIRAASWSGNAGRCAIEADHVHNLPNVVKELSAKALRYYWEIERQAFLDQCCRDNVSVAEFEPAWQRVGAFMEASAVPVLAKC